MKRNKCAEENRKNATKILSRLAEIRGLTEDMSAKRRLRDAEEKLAVAAPVLETDVRALDADVLKMLGEFLSVSKEGVLTERYLARIEELIARRRTLK